MFVIVESGSSKTDWVIVRDDDTLVFFETAGINPTLQYQFINLSEEQNLVSHLKNADDIYYYGAGVSNHMAKDLIRQWLTGYGVSAMIWVYDDMMAAARASCSNEKGIIGILGTGSNSCVYDGQNIIRSVPSLGYIFSDEGGGVSIGKEVLKSYFYGLMPKDVSNVFNKTYNISKEKVLENVYKSPEGNKFVASFVEFLQLTDSEWKDEILKKVFRDFINVRILAYPEHTHYNINFVGSIAFHFQKELNQVMGEYGLSINSILHKPIKKLIDYHSKQS